MARLIRHEADGPYKVEPGEKPVWICGCGLSREMPFCDGSHKAARQEQPGRLYVYDCDREKVVEERADG